MVTKTTLSVTVEPEFKAIAREIAKEQNITVSKLVSRYLEKLAQERITKLMEEGYRKMAEENKLLAEQSLSVALETWPKEGGD